MFSCGLSESQNGQVQFHDMLPSVLSSVLDFIYTGKIQVPTTDLKGHNTCELTLLLTLDGRNNCGWSFGCCRYVATSISSNVMPLVANE